MRREPGRESKAYWHDLVAALGEDGCPVCRLVASGVDRYLDGVLWELVLDLQVRADMNKARGYCNRHAWILVRTGSALGVAILMNGVLKTLLEVLDSTRGEETPRSVLRRLGRKSSERGARLDHALSAERDCPVCDFAGGLEEDIVVSLVSHLIGPDALDEAYRSSSGLCLAHLRLALSRAPSDAEAEVLVDAQRTAWEQLHGELEEFIRKNDHRFQGEGFGAERDSWLRALESISGPPGPERTRAARARPSSS